MPLARVELADGDPRGVEPIPDRVRTRVTNMIRRERRARPRIVETIFLRSPDGAAEVWALYRYRLWDACVNGGGSLELALEETEEEERTAEPSEEVRDACRNELGFNIIEIGSTQARMACTGMGLFRASFGAPRAGTVETERGGAVASRAHVEVGTGCTLDTLNAFHLKDWDADGELELLVDEWSHSPQWETRGDPAGRIRDRRARSIAFFRADLSAQARIHGRQQVAPPGDEPWVPGNTAVRYEMRGRDIAITRVTYWGSDDGCGEEGVDQWPARLRRRRAPAGTPDPIDWIVEQAQEDESWDLECVGAVTEERRRYVAARDAWLGAEDLEELEEETPP